jgi:hypothetical protein
VPHTLALSLSSPLLAGTIIRTKNTIAALDGFGQEGVPVIVLYPKVRKAKRENAKNENVKNEKKMNMKRTG